MKKTIISFMVFLFLCSCSNSLESSKEVNARAADSISKVIEKQFEEEKKVCQKLWSDTTYKKMFSAFCPADTMRMPMICSLKKIPLIQV